MCGCLLLGAAEAQGAQPPEVVGEVFGRPVTATEFAYYYKTATFFSRDGQASRTQEQTEQEAWQDLILLREVDRLGIQVSREELVTELRRLLGDRGVEYGGPAYAEWVRKTLGDDVATFERRITDLLKINALMKRQADPDVTVTDEEVKQKFLNQYNSFECEYIRFETAADADAFLDRVRATPALWKPLFEQQRTALGQKGASWINIMTLEALIDLWQFPKDDAYHVLAQPEGSFIRAKHIYGELVVRLLSTQHANLQEFTEAKQQELRKNLTQSKKYQLSKQYFDDLKTRAAQRNYLQERRDAEAQARRRALIPILRKKSHVVLETSRGIIALRLFPEAAPKACENFIGLIEKGYYNGLLFHRVKKGFMIQGGDPTGTGTGGESLWGKPFEDEVKPDVTFDRPGLLAMANSGPNTNASQFFITTVPTPHLNGKHTIFGEVVSGMDAVTQIESVPTDAADKPLEPQKILQARVEAMPEVQIEEAPAQP